MTITEIALLRLILPITADDASLRSKLSDAKIVMEKYTGHTFYYMQQVENPALVYVIGEWETLDQHMNDFIPSHDNQALLDSLKDELTVDWLIHIDASHAALPFSMASQSNSGCVYSISRYFVKEGFVQEFKDTFEAKKQYLDMFVTEGKIGGGWRVDKDGEKEEFVLWCPWKDIDQHLSFAATDGFSKYVMITDFLDGAETKHAKVIDV